jgi:guanylate kinase
MKSNGQGLLVILSAPSGCGKTTVTNRLLEQRADLVRSISCTTRKPRKQEKDGKDYFFIPQREFLQERRRGSFLEWADVFGHFYGTSRSFVLNTLRSGKDVVLTIDVQGARKVRKKIPCATIFLMPPSFQDLKKRLLSRKTESPRSFETRLQKAAWEMKQARDYDYIVVNRTVGGSIRQIDRIIEKEKKRFRRKKK